MFFEIVFKNAAIFVRAILITPLPLVSKDGKYSK